MFDLKEPIAKLSASAENAGKIAGLIWAVKALDRAASLDELRAQIMRHLDELMPK